MQCTNWSGTLSRDGYGRQWVNALRLYKQAHRLAYCKARGLELSAIAGQVVRHMCDNRRCVNPAHLELGTCAENSADMVERERQAKGADNGNATLAAVDVLAIRKRYIKGSRLHGGPALSREYHVTATTICNIINRHQWRHI